MVQSDNATEPYTLLGQPPRAMVVVGDGGNDNRGAEEVHNGPALRLGLAIPRRIVSRTGAAAAAAL